MRVAFAAGLGVMVLSACGLDIEGTLDVSTAGAGGVGGKGGAGGNVLAGSGGTSGSGGSAGTGAGQGGSSGKGGGGSSGQGGKSGGGSGGLGGSAGAQSGGGGSAGDGGAGGAGQGGTGGCKNDDECNDGNPCTTPTCDAGTCTHPANDAAVPAQVEGDCRKKVCSGGSIAEQNDDSDKPKTDANKCDIEGCADGEVIHTPEPDNKLCDQGGTTGFCLGGTCTVQCKPGDTCDDSNPCTTDECSGGKCKNTAMADDTPTPGVTDTKGDCKVSVCIGGGATPKTDKGDLPAVSECQNPLCGDDGTPGSSNKPDLTGCTNGGEYCKGGACTPNTCNDGVLLGGEKCDQSNFNGATCASETGKGDATGALTCKGDCTIDSSKCVFCGDGTKNNAEKCDGKDLDGKNCDSVVGAGTTGTLGCKADCSDFDTGGCVAAPTCTDNTTNGKETDKDCGGGTCPKCDDGLTCMGPGDCKSGLCDGTKKCASASCTDKATNGNETDTDCGGGTCPVCPNTKKCKVDKDCRSAFCDAGSGMSCQQPPTCSGATCSAGKNCTGDRCMPSDAEVIPTSSGGACPGGWTEVGGVCYLRGNNNYSWYFAFDKCREIGGNLATFDDQNQMQAVADALGIDSDFDGSFWIGLSCKNATSCDKKTSWGWLGGASLNFDDWGGGTPASAPTEHCAFIHDFGTGIRLLNDPCDAQQHLVCERAK